MLAHAHNKYLVILGFILAGGLAAGVWLIDFGFLNPEEFQRPTSEPKTEPEDDKPWFEPRDWTVIASSLESAREPIIVVPPKPEPEVEVVENPKPEPVRRLPPLEWKYKGYIVVSGTRRALVEVEDGTEQFLTVNTTLPDINNAAGEVRIVEILPEKLVVDRGLEGNEDVPLISRKESGADRLAERNGNRNPDAGRF